MTHLHLLHPTQESFATNDPPRPILPRNPQFPQSTCGHPWASVAMVMSHYNETSLQCFDCGAKMMVNGVVLSFQLK